MTPEAQRIAIAEACGWKAYTGSAFINYEFAPGHTSRCIPRWHKPEFGRYGDDAPQVCAMELPDYPTDLNAMHEAEKVLTDDEKKWHHYRDWLFVVCEPHRNVINAAAAQRAEAFLRTLGKWEDGK